MLSSIARRRLFLSQPRFIPTTATNPIAIRHLHATTTRPYPRKDTQDRESMNTESNEYSKSGGGDNSAAAATEDVAFSADKTKPEEEHDAAEQETKGQGNMSNPLNVSPANPEISQPRGEQEGGPDGSPGETGQKNESERARTSGGGSARKSGGGLHGGGG